MAHRLKRKRGLHFAAAHKAFRIHFESKWLYEVRFLGPVAYRAELNIEQDGGDLSCYIPFRFNFG